MAVVRDFFRTTSTSSISTIILNESPLCTASRGEPPPPQLELDALSPSCRLFTRRTEPLSGASSLDRTAADGARWTTELPGLATDAVDTAGGLAVARHRLRCTARRWAA